MDRMSFREQLEAIRPRLGTATPSIHPILHIDLDLRGDDPEQALRIARHEVLKWVAARVGKLPKAAWEFQSFEHLPGGSAAHAVRLQRDDCDYWITRCDDPDKSVPRRTWTTEVSVVGHAAGARFAIRQQMSTSESLPSFVPAVPGVVQQVNERPGLHRWGRALSVAPWLVADDDDADQLIALIEDTRRRRPVIIASLGEEETHPATTVIDVTSLAKRVLGLAHVAVVTGPVTFSLTARWGKQYSCFHRAVRMYLPGFDPDQDSPYEHPLALPHRIEAWYDERGYAFVDHLVQRSAAESLRQIRYDQDLPSYSSVKQTALQEERHHAQAGGRSDADLLELAEEQIAEQQREIDQLYGALAEEEERTKEALAEAQDATNQWYWLKERVALLERELADFGHPVDQEVEIPNTLAEVKAWADRHLAGRLVVTSKAVRAAKASALAEPEVAYKALLLLANEYQSMRIDGDEASRTRFEEGLKRLGLRNERSGEETRLREQGDEFLVNWDGRKRTLEWHLKNGGNTRDPRRCFRLYYFWDEGKQIVVVGSLPAHLTTRCT